MGRPIMMRPVAAIASLNGGKWGGSRPSGADMGQGCARLLELGVLRRSACK